VLLLRGWLGGVALAGVPSSCMPWKARVIVPTWGWWNVLSGVAVRRVTS
jgi:hypothetical protein